MKKKWWEKPRGDGRLGWVGTRPLGPTEDNDRANHVPRVLRSRLRDETLESVGFETCGRMNRNHAPSSLIALRKPSKIALHDRLMGHAAQRF